MFRRVLLLSVGALGLLLVLAAPGQLHAQHFRGSLPNRVSPGMARMSRPGFRGSRMIRPGFRGSRMIRPGFRGRFNSRFNRRFFDSRFNRGFFDPRFNTGFSPRFNSGFDLRFNRGLFDPRFSPGIGSGFFPPF
jgi:hypothetical protein